jgi:molybdopterin adenylyltransferase
MSHSVHRSRAKDIRGRCAVITCSDTRTADTDGSGIAIVDALEREGHQVVAHAIVPDDPSRIVTILQAHVRDGLNVVLINGGTGISSRDSTFEAISGMLEKTLPGFGELFRSLSFGEIGAAAMLSRAVAGVVGSTIVFSMPGSTPAVDLAMERLILPELRHLIWELKRVD